MPAAQSTSISVCQFLYLSVLCLNPSSSNFLRQSLSQFPFLYFYLKVSITLHIYNLSACISLSTFIHSSILYLSTHLFVSLYLSVYLPVCDVLDTGGTHKTDQRHHLHLAPLPRHPLSKQGGGRGASMGRGSSINQSYRPLLQLHPFAVSSGVPFITPSLPPSLTLSLPLPLVPGPYPSKLSPSPSLSFPPFTLPPSLHRVLPCFPPYPLLPTVPCLPSPSPRFSLSPLDSICFPSCFLFSSVIVLFANMPCTFFLGLLNAS